MRRPLKPFVTEYKQSNRRPPAPGTEQSPSESERPPPRLFDLASNESEDSYDAAMRAADALFSIPSTRALASSDAKPAQSQPISAERQAPNVERTPLPEPGTADKPGGRILRVLDEAPDPKFAALEAEHAPKRRGRKPGSKNKPKAAITAVDTSPISAAPLQIRAMPVAPPVPAIQKAAALSAVPPKTAAPRAAFPQAVATHGLPLSASAPPAEAPKGDKKFAWVRDRLRPGEEWKRRRLPRVCW